VFDVNFATPNLYLTEFNERFGSKITAPNPLLLPKADKSDIA
jgi:hypothetical protein